MDQFGQLDRRVFSLDRIPVSSNHIRWLNPIRFGSKTWETKKRNSTLLKSKRFANGIPSQLAPWRGLEPPTPRLGGECSIQLSYQGVFNFCCIFKGFLTFEVTRPRLDCHISAWDVSRSSYLGQKHLHAILAGGWICRLHVFVSIRTQQSNSIQN